MARRPFSGVITDLADLLIPVACSGCGAPGPAPCRRCADSLRSLEPYLVRPPSLVAVPIAAGGAFDGPLRRMLIAHKERGRRGLSASLGGLLADAVLVASEGAATSLIAGGGRSVAPRWVLVPAPSRRSAVRARGDDTVASLARAAAATLTQAGHMSISVNCLRHRRAVRDQAGLSADERGRNVAGALRLSRTPGQGPDDLVVVVDDITTTGATLAESVRVLRDHGVNVVAAAAVATTPRRTGVPVLRAGRITVDEGGLLDLVPSRIRH